MAEQSPTNKHASNKPSDSDVNPNPGIHPRDVLASDNESSIQFFPADEVDSTFFIDNSSDDGMDDLSMNSDFSSNSSS